MNMWVSACVSPSEVKSKHKAATLLRVTYYAKKIKAVGFYKGGGRKNVG